MKKGTIILVDKPKTGRNFLETVYNHILPVGIRWFTQCQYHHVAVVAYRKAFDELWVYESVFHGFKPTYSVENYLKRIKDENINILTITPEELPENFDTKVEEIYGAKYDFLGVFFHQIVYQLGKRWFNKEIWLGSKGTGARLRSYCSESVAYIFGHEDWWRWTAADFYNHYIISK